MKLGYLDGISYCSDSGDCGYIPLRGEHAFPKENVARWVTDLFQSDAQIVMHNSPYDIGWITTELKCKPPAHLHDTLLLSVLLDENRVDYSLDALCRIYGIDGKDEQLLKEAAMAFGLQGRYKNGRPKRKIGARELKQNMWQLPNEFKGPYAEQDAKATLELFSHIHKDVDGQGLAHAYAVDIQLIPMTVEMRRRGIRVDEDAIDYGISQLHEKRDKGLALLTDKCNLGREVTLEDVRSPGMLEALFDTENIPYQRTPKSQQGSFTSDWMTDHPHWLPSTVAMVRATSDAADKFLGGYIRDHLNNGRIHAEIHSFRSNEGGTRSHRFSYSNPPLQQMPSRNPEIAALIRGAFLPEEGCDWLCADYSQQEPRMTVHYAILEKVAGWKEALEYYLHGDGDYHQMVSDFTGLPRGEAKIINLGLAYGMGLYLLAASLGVSTEEAQRILDMYHQKVPFVKALTQTCTKLANKRGWIKLIDGARCRFNEWELRHLPDDIGWRTYSLKEVKAKFPNRQIRRYGTHKAFNRLIQGSSARQTKQAMVNFYNEDIIPMLQMHDDLNFNIHSLKEAEHVGEIMRECMPLKVPMQVDLEVGRNWGEAKQIASDYYA
jgi:DNA polymerase I-like protein with 3'-5' exonuclease and polymerase domains